MGKSSWAVAFGTCRAMILMSSRQPWLPAQDQIIPNLRIYGVDEFQAPPYTDELLSMDRAWGRRITLLRMW